MNNLTSSTNNLEWRRSKVLELSSQGYTQSDIATTLQISQSSVNRDLAYIAKQAQENLKTHIQHTLSLEFKRCKNGVNQILRQAWQISQSSDVRKEEKLAALTLASNCYKFIKELATDGVAIADAIKYFEGKMDHLNKEEKNLLQDIKDKENAETVPNQEEESQSEQDLEQQTHNTVF